MTQGSGFTVPDAVVRAADQIEVVDLAPQSLRDRLSAGVVYPAERIDAVAVRGREMGCCKMTLEVRPDNEPGLALYKKAGFNRSMLGNYPYWMMDKSL